MQQRGKKTKLLKKKRSYLLIYSEKSNKKFEKTDVVCENGLNIFFPLFWKIYLFEMDFSFGHLIF